MKNNGKCLIPENPEVDEAYNFLIIPRIDTVQFSFIIYRTDQSVFITKKLINLPLDDHIQTLISLPVPSFSNLENSTAQSYILYV